MKKYNISNYIKYKEDLKNSQPIKKDLLDYNRNELIVKFLPLVENIARKFSTSQQAAGVMSVLDFIQEGSAGLTKAVDKLDYTMLKDSKDKEKTLKSFFFKRIKGAIRRIPIKGSILSNIGQGGKAVKTDLTKSELYIANTVAKNLKKNQIVFAGIDLISNYLIGDINITSPTGLKNFKDLTGINLAVDFWNYLEN